MCMIITRLRDFTLDAYMAPKLPIRIPCRCARCSQAQGGFIHQTKQVVAKHAKAYPLPLTPPAPALLPSTQQNQPHLNQHHSENQYDENLPPVDANDGLGDFGHGADDFGQDLLPFEALGPSQPPSRVPSPARFYQQIDEVFTSVEPPLIPDPEIDRFQVDRPSLAIPAMKEEPYIRLAYLQAVMGNVFGKLTWEMATQTLNNTLDCLAIAGRLPVHPRPVRTLQSARQR